MLHKNLILLAFVVTCLLNQYLKWFNIKKLLCISIIYKIIISILQWIFVFFNLNNVILYIVLFVLIIYGFLSSDNKKKSIFKLIFLLEFWCLFTIIFNLGWFDMDSIILKSIMLIFLTNYMVNDIDYFSDLNPSNSKHILDALHNLLKNLNIKDLLSSGGGGGGPDPDFLPYMYLLIDTDDESKIGIIKPIDIINKIFLNSSYNNSLSMRFDEHNKHIIYPIKDEMIEEKNKFLSTNQFISYHFSNPYSLTFFGGKSNDISNFFENFKVNIFSDIEKYNNLLLCKFYYESENKNLLPNKFKNLWENWHSNQLCYGSSEKDMHYYPNRYVINLIRKDAAYGELNDNILIIGLNILCKMYIYTNLYYDYLPDFYVSKVEFYTKAWEYYKESLQKYYPFFHHYNWFCKLYILEHATKTHYLSILKNESIFNENNATVPPLREHILNWYKRPEWSNDVRPDKYPIYKEYPFPCIGGSTRVYFEWSNMENFLNKKLIIKCFASKGLPTSKIPCYPFTPSKSYFAPLYEKDLMSFKIKNAREVTYNNPCTMRDFFLFRYKFLWKST